MAQAVQALAQFQQQLASGVSPSVQQLQQLLTQLTSTQTTQAQSTNQLATAYLAMAQAIQQQTQAYTHAQAAALAYRQEQDAARAAARQAAQDASEMASVWSRAFSIAGAVGLATSIEQTIRAARQALTEFLESVVQVGTRMEGLRLGFQNLFGGPGGGAQAFERLTSFAQRFGIELLSLTETFRRFSAATRGTALEGQRGENVFESFMLAGRAVGSSQAQLNQLGLAIEQMVSKGVVSMEELRRQMGNALPGAFQVAARAMGMTTEELDKLIRKGHTEAIPFLEAMARQLRTEFGPAAETAANSAGAAFARFGNEVLLLKDAIAGSGIIQWLRDLNNWAADILANVREIRAERERGAGGAPVEVPSTFQQSPEFQARQREIELLRRSLLPEVQISGDMPDLVPGLARGNRTVEETRQRIEELQKQQRQVIENYQRMQTVERDQAGSAQDLMGGAGERINKIFEEGQRRLRDIDLNAQFLPALEVADEKFKSWEKTLKSIREEFDKIGPGIRQGLRPGGQPSQFDELITRLAGERGVDPNLVKALVEQESGYNPIAVSRAGARGLMQLMPGTAARYGAGGREFEPEVNLRAGIAYLAELLKQFGGDVNRALTAYNAGPARGGIPLPTGENATFARDVLRRMPGEPLDVLQQAQRMQEALRAGREAQTPDPEARARVMATGREVLRQLDEEIKQRQRIQEQAETYAATLARVQEFLRQPTQTLAEQAAARVEGQGAQLQATLRKALLDLQNDPAVLNIAPQLTQQFETALATLPDAVAAQAGIAAARVTEQQARLTRQMASQVEQVQLQMGGLTLTPFQREVSEIGRRFESWNDQLTEFARTLEERRPLVSEDEQARIDAVLASIRAILAARGQLEQQAVSRALSAPQEAYLRDLEEQLRQQQEPRQQGGFPVYQRTPEQELDRRNVQQLERRGAPLFVDQQSRQRARDLLEQQRNMERLTYYAGLFEQMGTSVGNAWTNALMGIASGTQTVSQAFRQMAQSILQSIIQITSQEAWKSLISFGVRMILGGATGTIGATTPGGGFYQAPAGGGAPFTPPPIAFQEGGIARRPTFAHIAEGGPEAVIPLSRMGEVASQMGSSAGGQAAGGSTGITIINVANQAEAERQRAQQESMGRQVIMNTILADLGKGEASSVNRAIRTIQR